MTVCVSVGDVNGDSVEIDVVDSVDIAGRCVDVVIGNSVDVTVGDPVDAVSVRLSADEDVIGRSVAGVVDIAVDCSVESFVCDSVVIFVAGSVDVVVGIVVGNSVDVTSVVEGSVDEGFDVSAVVGGWVGFVESVVGDSVDIVVADSVDIAVGDSVAVDCSVDEICDAVDDGVDGMAVEFVEIIVCDSVDEPVVDAIIVVSSVGEVVSDLLSIVVGAEVGLCGSAVVSCTFGVTVD